MFKKISFVILIIVSFTILFAGCSSGNDNNQQPTIKPTQKSTITPKPITTASPKTTFTPDQQLQLPAKGEQIAIMETSMGTIKIKFFPQFAPKAVENFITHAKAGYYNGMKFHRVIKDFMIQSGDPLGTGSGGESIWNAPFKNEVSDNLHHYRGALSMANAGPDTNGSQFFIVQSKTAVGSSSSTDEKVKSKYTEVGGYPSLDMSYSVFGQAFQGMDIVDKIAAVATTGDDPTPPTLANKPLTDVIIKTVTIQNY